MEISIETKKFRQILILIGLLGIIYILSLTGNAIFYKESHVSEKEIIWPFCDFGYIHNNFNDNTSDQDFYYDSEKNQYRLREEIVFNGLFYGFGFTDFLLNLIIGLIFILEFNRYLNWKNYLIVFSVFLIILYTSSIYSVNDYRFWPFCIVDKGMILDGFSSMEFSLYSMLTLFIIYLTKKYLKPQNYEREKTNEN